MRVTTTTDVLIVGGGVIGLSLAWELAGQGRAVTVVEQGEPGREASWAGAGILPPGNLPGAKTPEAKLRAFSATLWSDWTRQLCEDTGIDNGFRACGAMQVVREGSPVRLKAEHDHWREEGVAAEWIAPGELASVEPALHPESSAAFLLPAACQVRNPRHLKALVAGCMQRGVQMARGTPVIGMDIERKPAAGSGDVEAASENRVVAIRTTGGSFSADQVCIASGAWSRSVLGSAGVEIDIEPVRGQIVLLSVPSLPFTRVIEVGPRYLVPRPDGRILIGSTEERAGFDRSNTAAGVAGLIEFATRLVPVLSEARLERCWAGLRPGSTSGMPLLGAVPGFNNLFIAAGHFRAGLQMSPGTAVLMRQCLLGQATAIPLEPYRIGSR